MKQLQKLFSLAESYFELKYGGVSATLLGIIIFAFLACGTTDSNNDILTDLEQASILFEQLTDDPGNVTILFPDEDPGIPIYARVGPILNQFFVTDGQLVIPFYRDPECIRGDFNFFAYYDPPVAFGCDLTVKGKFVIEANAEQGTFPIMAHTGGTQVPVWVVDWAEFQALMENESVTLPEIETLNPIMAMAHHYEEYLSPRMDEHEVIIEASGTIPGTGQQFTFVLTHRGDQIEKILLEIE
jgi:hypothetical protein